MKNCFIILTLFYFLCNSSVGQIRWDMEYLSIESVGKNLISKEIRIDFRKSVNDTLNSKNINIRGLIGIKKQDTIALPINNYKKLFKEAWNHYPDKGLLREQYLQQVNDEKIIIKEIYLIAVDEENIKIEMWLYQNNTFFEKIIIDIPKSLIKGIIARIY